MPALDARLNLPRKKLRNSDDSPFECARQKDDSLHAVRTMTNEVMDVDSHRDFPAVAGSRGGWHCVC
jgi:hypothetical protein